MNSNDFFHAPTTAHSITVNFDGFYAIGKGFLGGIEAKRKWDAFFKTMNAVHWNAIATNGGEATYLVATVGGCLIHPLGFTMAVNRELSDGIGKHVVSDLRNVLDKLCEAMGGTYTIEVR